MSQRGGSHFESAVSFQMYAYSRSIQFMKGSLAGGLLLTCVDVNVKDPPVFKYLLGIRNTFL